MRTTWTVCLLGAILAALALPTSAFGAEAVNGPKTPLDEYVAKPDPAYTWKVVQTIPGDGITTRDSAVIASRVAPRRCSNCSRTRAT